MSDARHQQLDRGLGGLPLVGLIINCVVGAGVLGLPGKTFAIAGDWTYAVLIAAALLALLVALCLAELGSRFTETGGPVLYVGRAFGDTAGFTAGWVLWAATVLASAALLNLFATYAAPLIGGGAAGRAIVIAVSALVLTGMALAGIRQSALANSVLITAKLLLLAGIALVGLFVVPADPAQPVGAIKPTDALVVLFFAFVGFERPTAVAGEIRNVQRELPIALLAGVAILTLLYLGVFAACLRAVPGLATDATPLNTIAETAFGPQGLALMTGGAMVVLAGTMFTQFITAPRLLLGMAEERQLPGRLAYVSPRRLTPDLAILVTGAVAWALAMSGDFVGALTASSSSRLVVFLACALALIMFRRRDGGSGARFRLPLGTAIAALTALACIAVLLLGAVGELLRLAIVIGAGLLLFAATRVSRRG